MWWFPRLSCGGLLLPWYIAISLRCSADSFQLDGDVKSLHKKWLEITKHPLKEGGNAFTALDGSEIRQTS